MSQILKLKGSTSIFILDLYKPKKQLVYAPSVLDGCTSLVPIYA